MPDGNSEDELYEKVKVLESLKAEIDEKIENIEAQGDEKTKKRISKMRNHFKKNKDNYDISNDENIDENIDKLKKINTGVHFYQKVLNAFETTIDIDPGRLMGLTDGIFGMVMTLLIFGMALPEGEILNYTGFLNFSQSILPTVGITLVSFILLSSFWIYHHEFIKIKSLNMPYLWINILFLACISFIPFTTSIIGNYSQFFLANFIFGANIFLTILFFLCMYHYAYSRGFLENDVSDEERKYVKHTLYIIMLVIIIVNLLDFNINKNFIYLFFLVPIISTVRDILFRLKQK